MSLNFDYLLNNLISKSEGNSEKPKPDQKGYIWPVIVIMILAVIPVFLIFSGKEASDEILLFYFSIFIIFCLFLIVYYCIGKSNQKKSTNSFSNDYKYKLLQYTIGEIISLYKMKLELATSQRDEDNSDEDNSDEDIENIRKIIGKISKVVQEIATLKNSLENLQKQRENE